MVIGDKISNHSNSGFSSEFPGSDREVLDDVYELLRLLIEVYEYLEIPFRLRLAEPPELSFVEQLRVDLEVWSPFEKIWKPVAHVASHGQFIASRLTMVRHSPLHSSIHPSATSNLNPPLTYSCLQISKGEPMFTMFGVCADAQRIIALLLENHQKSDGTYSLPKHLRAS